MNGAGVPPELQRSAPPPFAAAGAVARGAGAGRLVVAGRRGAHRARFVGNDLLRGPLSWLRRLRQAERVRLHGVELAVDASLGPGVRRSLYDGRYERGEAFALRARLGAEDRVLEFGTGLGLLAILAARRVGSANVVTCEANPRLLPLIRDNCRRNGVDPLVLHGAVGVHDRCAVLHLEDEHTGSSVHAPGHAASGHAASRNGGQSVEVPFLDAARQVERYRPSFVILDVEGAEREIVPEIDWTPVHKILLELHPQHYGAEGGRALLAHLSAAGFRVDRVVSSQHKLLLQR